MSAVEDLIRDVQAAGVTLRSDPPNLVIKPAARLTPELEDRLRKYKPEILRRLELEASMRRLEAVGVSVAIRENGEMHIVLTEYEISSAVRDGGTIYTPADMYHCCVTLTPSQRRLFHSFKRTFPQSTTEWRKWT